MSWQAVAVPPDFPFLWMAVPLPSGHPGPHPLNLVATLMRLLSHPSLIVLWLVVAHASLEGGPLSEELQVVFP